MGRGAANFGKIAKGGGGPELDASVGSAADPDSAMNRHARRSIVTGLNTDGLLHRIISERQRVDDRRQEMAAIVSNSFLDRKLAWQTFAMENRRTQRQDKAADLQHRAAAIRLDLLTRIQAVSGNVQAPEQAWLDLVQQLDHACRSHRIQVEEILQLFYRWSSARALSAQGRLQCLDRMMSRDQTGLGRAYRDALMPVIAALKQSKVELGAAVDDSDQSWQAMKEAIKNKQVERLNNLQVKMTGLIENCEQLFRAEYRRYLDAGGERAAEFDALLKRDAALAVEISQRAARITSLLNAVDFWRNELKQAQAICAERNNSLRDQRHRLMMDYAQLKDEKGRKLAASIAACKHLSKRCQWAQRHLQKLLQQSRRILVLAQQTARGRRSASGSSHRWMPESADHRRAMAQMQNRLMLVRRQMARKENDDLRSALASFLRETTVSADSLNRPNTLFIINGRSPRLLTPRPLTNDKTDQTLDSAPIVVRPVCY